MTNPERLYVTYFCLSGPQTEAYLADGPEGHEGCPVVAEYVLASVVETETAALRREREALLSGEFVQKIAAEREAFRAALEKIAAIMVPGQAWEPYQAMETARDALRSAPPSPPKYDFKKWADEIRAMAAPVEDADGWHACLRTSEDGRKFFRNLTEGERGLQLGDVGTHEQAVSASLRSPGAWEADVVRVFPFGAHEAAVKAAVDAALAATKGVG